MSTRFILRDFTLNRDFHAVSWGITLWYNGLRSLAAGIVFITLTSLVPETDLPMVEALRLILAWPFFYAFFLFPIGLVASRFPHVWLLSILTLLIGIIGVALGDPIIRTIATIFPAAIPVQNPPIFSTRLIFWVLNQPEIVVANNRSISQN